MMEKMLNPIQDTKALIQSVIAFLQKTPWRAIYIDRLEMLKERCEQPCELAVVGRVKAGKSSFLNALLGEDLAMVGTAETTATINYFRYGHPLDALHPVKVIWEDGHEEWQTKDFLDALQGNTSEILQRAKKIVRLEYFVDNPILHDITLVDTPGTGALVSEHEDRTQDYLFGEREALRKKHNDQSIALKERADAVVVITERVPTSQTDRLVENLSADTSAVNALGVMTKIDLEESTTAEDWTRRGQEYSKMLRHQLSAVIPVSAGVFHAVSRLSKDGTLSRLKDLLGRIPDEQFDELLADSNLFLSQGEDECALFDSYGLSCELRKEMVGGMDYMVFLRVAKELMRCSIQEASERLVAYSGMESLKELLDRQFFSRSRIIRCASVARQVHAILDEISNHHLYGVRVESRNRKAYLRLVEDADADKEMKKSLADFISRMICTEEQYKQYEKDVSTMLRRTEALQQSFFVTDNRSEALILLERKHACFRETEIEELERLFGKYPDSDQRKEKSYCNKRWNFWNARRQQVSDVEVKRIAELAMDIYGTLL